MALPCNPRPRSQGVKLDLKERVIELVLTCYAYQDCTPAEGELYGGLARLPKLRVL